MDSKDIITILYYVVSLIIQGLAFVFGILYVLRRDGRQREEDEAQKKLRLDVDDRRRREEKRKQRLQEWRKFSQELNLKYIDMKRDKVIQRLQHAKESLKVCRILPHINGLDVLKYMINDEDSFVNSVLDGSYLSKQTFKPTALGELRLDLRSVFVLINYCWSLCLLGDIPENFNREMRRIVIVLGNLALSFCSKELDGHRFRIIKECLEKFGENPPIPQQMDREELTDKIPYVKFLRYEPDIKTGKIFTFETDELRSQEAKFLKELNFELVESNSAENYALRFAKKMKELKKGWIGGNASDEAMVLKLIHDVRCIAWKTENAPLDTEDEDLLEALKVVRECKEVPRIRCQQEAVKGLITRFKGDLQDHFERYGYKNFKFLKKLLNDLQGELKGLQIPEFANDE